MSFFSDPLGGISDAVSGLGNDINRIPQDISQFAHNPSQALGNLWHNPGVPEGALLAGALFTGGADLIPTALTDTVVPDVASSVIPEVAPAAAPVVDTTTTLANLNPATQAINEGLTVNVADPIGIDSLPSGIQANAAGLNPTVGANGFNAGITNAGYSTPMTNYAISPAANGITASGAGAANGLSIAPSAASVGANGAASYGLNAASATSGGVMDYFNSALNWMGEHKTATAVGAGILGSKLGLFSGKSNPGVDTTYNGPLNNYRLSPDFKPGGNANPTAISLAPYRNYQKNPYSVATGASGGIASMAIGGEAGQMYPQSQQEHTNFTPAPTLPNSMNNLMESYDTPTDPMTGDISQRLAYGGVARYASGDLTTTNDFLNMATTGSTSKGHHTDSLMQELNQYAMLGTNPDPFNTGYGAAGASSYGMGTGVVGNDDPDLRNKNPYQRAQIMNAKLAGVAGVQGLPQQNVGALGAMNFAPATQAAQGGIMRYDGGGQAQVDLHGSINMGGGGSSPQGANGYMPPGVDPRAVAANPQGYQQFVQQGQRQEQQYPGSTMFGQSPQMQTGTLGNYVPNSLMQMGFASGGVTRYDNGGPIAQLVAQNPGMFKNTNENEIDPKTGVPYSQEAINTLGSDSGGFFGGALNEIGKDVNNIGQSVNSGIHSIGKSLGFAHGGVPGGYNLGGYSDGGRLLKGPGDGMSDNIPATIAHKQPARLADGEFVVPADVVSHLGNGSTDAGAKRLYAMMDKVREARTGSKKQGKEINANKYLPK